MESENVRTGGDPGVTYPIPTFDVAGNPGHKEWSGCLNATHS